MAGDVARRAAWALGQARWAVDSVAHKKAPAGGRCFSGDAFSGLEAVLQVDRAHVNVGVVNFHAVIFDAHL